jgi:electron transport complex protein RnfG
MSAETPPAGPPAPPEPGSLRLVATVGIAGLVSGLAIVGTYEATLPRILENQAAALRAAVFEVVPESARLSPLVESGGDLAPVDPGAAAPGGQAPGAGAEVFAAWTESGEFAGYAIAAEGPGFQDTIKLLFGFDAETQRVVGMQVLESRETPGLGDKIFKDASFVAEFSDLAVSPEVIVVPKGTDDSPNAVDGITGATISSKAVAKIVNAGASRWKDRLPPQGFPASAAQEGD